METTTPPSTLSRSSQHPPLTNLLSSQPPHSPPSTTTTTRVTLNRPKTFPNVCLSLRCTRPTPQTLAETMATLTPPSTLSRSSQSQPPSTTTITTTLLPSLFHPKKQPPPSQQPYFLSPPPSITTRFVVVPLPERPKITYAHGCLSLRCTPPIPLSLRAPPRLRNLRLEHSIRTAKNNNNQTTVDKLAFHKLAAIFAISVSITNRLIQYMDVMLPKFVRVSPNPSLEEFAKLQSLKQHLAGSVGPMLFVAMRQSPGKVSKLLEVYMGVVMIKVLLEECPKSTPLDKKAFSAMRELCDPYLRVFGEVVPPVVNSLDMNPFSEFVLMGVFSPIMDAARGSWPSSSTKCLESSMSMSKVLAYV